MQPREGASGPQGPRESIEIAQTCARIASSRRATDIAILDLRGFSPVTSFFVIGTGTSRRQIQGIAEEITKEMKRGGLIPLGVEGKDEARWVLIDLGDVIVHLMNAEARAYYDLEMLWGDAEKVDWE